MTEQDLINAGFVKKLFFYQTGGGEDENDCEIFVKGNIVIKYQWHFERWIARPYDSIDYRLGFREYGSEVVQSIEDIEKLTF